MLKGLKGRKREEKEKDGGKGCVELFYESESIVIVD